MTSFGWKKKSLILNVSKSESTNESNVATNSFERCVGTDSLDAESTQNLTVGNEGTDYDWCVAFKKRKLSHHLETNEQKLTRLKDEGIKLAEHEEFWQAIGRWDDALNIIKENMLPGDTEQIYHDMKAQAFIQLHEWEPAIEAAELAIRIDPKWYSAHQTLGRAHLGIGNVLNAVKAFSRARHIRPNDEELKVTDLEWASSLLTHIKLIAAGKEMNKARDSYSESE